MRFLVLHVDSFKSTITEKGRAKFAEKVDQPVLEVEESLVVLASVEKSDERNPHIVAEKAAVELEKHARQLGVNTIVLHPFAHLFGELSSPAIAIAVLQEIEDRLSQQGFYTHRTPFGWFNTLDIKAKGHPLSRVARIITAD